MILKRILAVITVILVLAAIILVKGEHKFQTKQTQQFEQFQSGDLIFQTSLSNQSKAIQLATKSPYSHCGIIYKNGDQFFVFEAIGPVKLTPLGNWIARGKDRKFVVKRLKNAAQLLTPSGLNQMKIEGEKLMGKNYDLTFEWNDDQIYCSELIWKVYKRGLNIEIAPLAKLQTFDFTHPIVKEITSKRYGKNIPINEPVISPKAIFDSELLTTVAAN